MRKISLFAAFILFAAIGHSQVDLKINPLNALFGKYSVNAEYLLKENVGLELGVDLIYQSFDLSVGTSSESGKRTGFGADISYNYYFKPEEACSKFYVFPYLAFRNRTWEDGVNSSGGRSKIKLTNVGIGAGIGYKWVASSNVIFDLGFGLGRNLVNNYSYEDSDGVNTEELELSVGIDARGKLAIGYRF